MFACKDKKPKIVIKVYPKNKDTPTKVGKGEEIYSVAREITLIAGITSTVAEVIYEYAGWDNPHSILSGKNLTGYGFGLGNFSHSNFDGANMIGANFTETPLDYSTFVGSDLSNTTFKNAKLDSVTFKSVNLTDSYFENKQVRLFLSEDRESVNKTTNVSFELANLTNAHFKSMYFSNSNFSSANLSGVCFNSNTVLERVKFTETILKKAIFQDVSLKDISFANINLEGAIFKDVTFSNVDFNGANLKEAKLEGLDMTNEIGNVNNKRNKYANFVGTDLTSAQLTMSILHNADFSEATLTRAELYKCNLLKANFTDAKMRRASLKMAIMNNTNFTRANLTSANLNNTTGSSTNFTQAELDLASFNNAILTYSIFQGADLENADLSYFVTNGIFNESNLRRTSFKCATLDNSSFVGAYFSQTDFTEACLRNCTFKGTDLRSANFTDTNLVNSNFKKADLSRAILNGANFKGADLTDAIFGDNDVSGVIISKCTKIGGISQKIVKQFTVKEATRKELDIPEEDWKQYTELKNNTDILDQVTADTVYSCEEESSEESEDITFTVRVSEPLIRDKPIIRIKKKVITTEDDNNVVRKEEIEVKEVSLPDIPGDISVYEVAMQYTPPTWKEHFEERKKELKVVSDLLVKRSEREIYTPGNARIFRAFQLTPPETIKVVIIGQDPYPGVGIATGLAFSTFPGNTVPASLKNIFKEIATCFPGYKIPTSGCLDGWAKQGVFLINTSLTCPIGDAGGHSKFNIWIPFVAATLKLIGKTNKNCYYLLWGKNAQECKTYITAKQDKILTAAHPSPLSASRGFFGCNHFKIVNKGLIASGQEPIKW